mmetsp:Transcript_9227/g.31773  ORF Transcript_9227/g.31773 Transcript_9227/m.31773 type:complete len:206 (+) Transcript_9227:1999-2616(+)
MHLKTRGRRGTTGDAASRIRETPPRRCARVDSEVRRRELRGAANRRLSRRRRRRGKGHREPPAFAFAGPRVFDVREVGGVVRVEDVALLAAAEHGFNLQRSEARFVRVFRRVFRRAAAARRGCLGARGRLRQAVAAEARVRARDKVAAAAVGRFAEARGFGASAVQRRAEGDLVHELWRRGGAELGVRLRPVAQERDGAGRFLED